MAFFGLFGKSKKPPKDTDSVEFRRYMANKLDGRAVRYVLERKDNVDTIVGKEGFISVYQDDLSVICGEKTLFRCAVDGLTACWEFLSLEGVVLTGVDIITGSEKTILAYYKYYRD